MMLVFLKEQERIKMFNKLWRRNVLLKTVLGDSLFSSKKSIKRLFQDLFREEKDLIII